MADDLRKTGLPTVDSNEKIAVPELGTVPVTEGRIYLVTPEGALTSTGTPWKGAFKKGIENKLLVYFYGGGVSVDAYTATCGLSVKGKEFFYFDDMSVWRSTAYKCFSEGIGNQDERNSFRNWSVMMLPYTTGDFHIGTGEFPYTGQDGVQHILYHHGYTNFKLYMDKVVPYAGSPDTVVVSGSSAGGFGTAFLADDVAGLFPQTKNFVACVDASQLYWEQFPATARDVWKAPEHIVSRLVSENPVLDSLVALHKEKPYVKILFGCSVRDATLAAFQNYFDKGAKSKASSEDTERFQKRLADFIKKLIKSNPQAGIFIWDDVVTNNEARATKHTIETGTAFLDDRSGNGSFAKWIYDATQGNVRIVGLETFFR